jgi:hypothetical protein
MRFLVLYFLACIPKNTKNMVIQLKQLNTFSLENELPITKTKILQNITGNDERFTNKNLTDIDINEKNKYKLLEFFEKKKLLDILENDKVTIPIKLSVIKDDNSIRGFRLTAGLKKEDYDFIL